MKVRCEKKNREPITLKCEIEKLPCKNIRTAKLFDAFNVFNVTVTKTDTEAAHIESSKVEARETGQPSA